MKKITILSILFFLLNILIVNSQLAKVYNEENLDFDRAYRDNYLQERNYFSDLNYEIVTGGYSQTSKVGGPYYNDYKAINLNNQKKYVFDLLSCNSYEKYCVFRINGVPTGKIEKGATFRLDEQYSMKIEDIVFDFCDNRAFCHLGYEAYNIVDFIIDGTSLAICGNGVCESGENCEGDNCCNGETIELKFDRNNCGGCGRVCSSDLMCEQGKCIELCPETNRCDYFKTRGFCHTSKSLGQSCDCNEECDSLTCFNDKCISSGSGDLSNYPNFLIKNNKLEVTIVVGNKAPSSNVLAQTNIGLSLASLETSVNIKNKLSSEIIEDLNQNIISVGNPCINEISAKIMGNPEPCGKDFQKGKGHIKLFENNGFFHLVVAGYSDLGTKKAADILANYKNYDIKGNEYTIEFAEEEDIQAEVTTEHKETAEEGEKSEKIEEAIESKEIIEEEQKIIEKETKIKGEEAQPILKEEDNLIKAIIKWFKSLFGFFKK
ncbi:hypothetical protein J4458_01760 [Candidatus Woesearchaeota archaeon]|nr:hypothetical protein [Candidatus Woesearchaeota archaeon]